MSSVALGNSVASLSIGALIRKWDNNTQDHPAETRHETKAPRLSAGRGT